MESSAESQDPSANAVGVAALVARVREELENLDRERRRSGRLPLFVLEELEIELQFIAVERREGGGGIDLKILSAAGSRGVEDSAIQRLCVRFSTDEQARKEQLIGTRSHSSAHRAGVVEDVEPLEVPDGGGVWRPS